jgi:hypothetical protein
MSNFINTSRGLGGMGIENDTCSLRLEKAIARLERLHILVNWSSIWCDATNISFE